ncbi:MAG: AMP-binding protein [Hyphomicrobium sp.]|nr:AMP-binding protein [Hyphomicrobium sp.]
MTRLLNLGEMLAAQARLAPERIGARDLERELTFRQWNGRACRLANGLIGLGLAKGDRVAVLAYNALEWAEIYAATAKAGLVAVPINFRLTGPEIRFIIENSGALALIVEDQLTGVVEEILADLPIAPERCLGFGNGKVPAGFRAYEDVLAAALDREPQVVVEPGDPWTLMYTSGTTGRPKGAIRNHGASALHSMITEVEFRLSARDTALLVMPMCHANSVFFYGAFAYCGATTAIYNRKSIDPEHLLATLAQSGATFSSLVPTHYIMMLALSSAVRARYDVERVERLLISSAPARHDTKLGILELFGNSGLYEMYGSTEAGWVTILRPDEQLSKLGSVGREVVGSGPVRLLAPDGSEVADGEAGELFSRTPWSFDGYWQLPDKTAEAFRGEYCSVGDLARRDADGFIHLVDRKSNMIISGGENIYPSEIETALGAHPKIKDVAIVGAPDEKWGERVHAFVILHDGLEATADELIEWCRDRVAPYKRPRSMSFIREEDMPRTATGKVLHRVLRGRLVT